MAQSRPEPRENDECSCTGGESACILKLHMSSRESGDRTAQRSIHVELNKVNMY